MKNKAKTQQSQNKLSQSAKPALSEEELDDIISDITLKRGRNAYTIYITEMYQKEKAQNENQTDGCVKEVLIKVGKGLRQGQRYL